MEKLFARIFGALGNLGSKGGNSACWVFFIDEPEMPKHMIEK